VHRILVAEDDPDIGALLRHHVSRCDARVRVESNGHRALMLAKHASWDVVILDWLLPGLDGISVCRELRASDYRRPIVLLTARTSEADRVAGLDAGADDYVTKPFSTAELLARVRVQLRRGRDLGSGAWPPATPSTLTLGPMRIDLAARTVTLAEHAIPLTTREFDLLAHFAQHPSRVFTRQELLHGVWGSGFEGYEYTVNSHINRLRAKLEPEPASPRFIVTVWGLGYRFDPPQ
jgi:two-component system OmpR family response regulator